MWIPFENGTTLGELGTEGGRIVRDELHTGGSRITLEARIEKRRIFRAPLVTYAITCGIFGWMVHTRFFTDEREAIRAFEEMKGGLEEILAIIPLEDDPELDARMEAVRPYLGAFVERFPT